MRGRTCCSSPLTSSYQSEENNTINFEIKELILYLKTHLGQPSVVGLKS